MSLFQNCSSYTYYHLLLDSSYNASVGSCSDLKALGVEAAENDGRLARCPLKDMEYEIKAHHILLSQLTRMIQDRDAADKVIVDALQLAYAQYVC